MLITKAAHQEAIKALEQRLEALEQRPDDLATAMKGLRIEWEDMLDRLQRVMGRLNARVRRDLPGEVPEETPQVPINPELARAELLKAARARRQHGLLRNG